MSRSIRRKLRGWIPALFTWVTMLVMPAMLAPALVWAGTPYSVH